MSAPPRTTLLALAASLLLLGPTLAAGDRGDGALTALRVFFPKGACSSELLEIETYDRSAGSWAPHPSHPRIYADTCQTEDPGILLNEIRVRCAAQPRRGEWNDWQLGVDVWDVERMERCPQEIPRRRRELVIDLELLGPRPGQVLESGNLEAQVEGLVRMDGRQPGRWDVVFMLDAAAASETYALRQDAAEALLGFAAELRSGGSLRTALISFTSGPKATAQAPKLDVGFEDDLVLLEASLRDLAAVPLSGAPGFTEALALALAELDSRGRPAASQAVIVLADGRAALPFGKQAGSDPAFRKQAVAAAQRARERMVPVHILALGMGNESAPELLDTMLDGTPSQWLPLADSAALASALAELPFARLESVEIRNPAAETPPQRAQITPGGRFSSTIRLRDGENALRLRALASSGSAADVRLRITLDNSQLRQVLLEREREHMRRVRALRKRVVIEPAEP